MHPLLSVSHFGVCATRARTRETTPPPNTHNTFNSPPTLPYARLKPHKRASTYLAYFNALKTPTARLTKLTPPRITKSGVGTLPRLLRLPLAVVPARDGARERHRRVVLRRNRDNHRHVVDDLAVVHVVHRHRDHVAGHAALAPVVVLVVTGEHVGVQHLRPLRVLQEPHLGAQHGVRLRHLRDELLDVDLCGQLVQVHVQLQLHFQLPFRLAVR